jgi:hypothetical protein
MDKKKEGLITSVPEALTEAAKINIAAAKEMASSAVTAFVDTVAGREKPRRGKRRVSKKKVSPASKRGKTKNSNIDWGQLAGKHCRVRSLPPRVLWRPAPGITLLRVAYVELGQNASVGTRNGLTGGDDDQLPPGW